MNKVVVTGGSGFLGSFVADTLSVEGFEVTVFDREPSPHLRSDQRMVVGDLLDGETLHTLLEGARFVYHLAALADLNEARGRPLETARTNVLGTVELLEAARNAGVERFLFASTVYVYSRAGGFYRCSKMAGEAYVEEYQQRYGLPYTILRYGSLYGPRADERNGVYRLLLQAARRGAVELEGGPDDSREYIHVEDAARLSVRALGEEFANQHLLITGHHGTRLRDLFVMFSEILGEDVGVDYRRPPAGAAAGHYRVTPYAYQPRLGRKLTSNHYVDMGQGILQMLDQMHRGGRLEEEPGPTSTAGEEP